MENYCQSVCRSPFTIKRSAIAVLPEVVLPATAIYSC